MPLRTSNFLSFSVVWFGTGLSCLLSQANYYIPLPVDLQLQTLCNILDLDVRETLSISTYTASQKESQKEYFDRFHSILSLISINIHKKNVSLILI